MMLPSLEIHDIAIKQTIDHFLEFAVGFQWEDGTPGALVTREAERWTKLYGKSNPYTSASLLWNLRLRAACWMQN